MDSRYGIHTIELFHRLSRKNFNKVFHSLKSLNSGSFYPDTTYHSEKGLTKYICTSYCGQGVVLYLYQQVRSKNKTKKNLASFIHFRLNPHTLLHGEYVPKKVFQAKENQLKSLDKEMTKLLHEIGLNCDFEQLTLSRIDCCLDYSPDSQDWVDEALRVVRRSPYMQKCAVSSTSLPQFKQILLILSPPSIISVIYAAGVRKRWRCRRKSTRLFSDIWSADSKVRPSRHWKKSCGRSTFHWRSCSPIQSQ